MMLAMTASIMFHYGHLARIALRQFDERSVTMDFSYLPETSVDFSSELLFNLRVVLYGLAFLVSFEVLVAGNTNPIVVG